MAVCDKKYTYNSGQASTAYIEHLEARLSLATASQPSCVLDPQCHTTVREHKSWEQILGLSGTELLALLVRPTSKALTSAWAFRACLLLFLENTVVPCDQRREYRWQVGPSSCQDDPTSSRPISLLRNSGCLYSKKTALP